jgi:pimeloyl-ACP methyl ester carboxylesterase
MPAAAIRRGYCDTPHGQLHWRRNRVDRLDVVLLHWAPASGRMYEATLVALEEQRLGALAFDLPGFGQSLRPPAPWGPTETARCLGTGLRELDRAAVAVVGGHLAANVAIEWAITAPEQVSRLVLDGVYAPTSEEGAALYAPYAGLTPRLRDDLSHERFVWRATCAFLHEWNPKFRPAPQTMAAVYDAMADYLLMGYESIVGWLEPGDAPPPAYDALARVACVASPLLALTAQFDALRPAYARVLQAQPHACGHDFPGAHPLMESGRAPEYAAVIANFVRGGVAAASAS